MSRCSMSRTLSLRSRTFFLLSSLLSSSFSSSFFFSFASKLACAIVVWRWKSATSWALLASLSLRCWRSSFRALLDWKAAMVLKMPIPPENYQTHDHDPKPNPKSHGWV
ncbi:hypothetical protein F4821DRAFT_243786 [Hypoxylon rubiginosum]|uniref:Uncharacterized protein n=1 Tax=Hypoxylon rubiginosum TaxID=110542 RepID=A0ACC0CTZ7_9PEZI|nr:hypothetical protein F4821DRAFT_243786 [Hypoxylon rubiginosum]